MVLRGRLKGERERTIVLAHQIEAMARQQKLKPVESYLKQKTRAVKSAAGAVVDMLKGMKAKGAGVTIKRIARPPKPGK